MNKNFNPFGEGHNYRDIDYNDLKKRQIALKRQLRGSLIGTKHALIVMKWPPNGSYDSKAGQKRLAQLPERYQDRSKLALFQEYISIKQEIKKEYKEREYTKELRFNIVTGIRDSRMNKIISRLELELETPHFKVKCYFKDNKIFCSYISVKLTSIYNSIYAYEDIELSESITRIDILKENVNKKLKLFENRCLEIIEYFTRGGWKACEKENYFEKTYYDCLTLYFTRHLYCRGKVLYKPHGHTETEKKLLFDGYNPPNSNDDFLEFEKVILDKIGTLPFIKNLLRYDEKDRVQIENIGIKCTRYMGRINFKFTGGVINSGFLDCRELDDLLSSVMSFNSANI